MQIHQLQMSYSRIIFRVSSTKYAEICLFLARRLVHDFWAMLVPVMQQFEPNTQRHAKNTRNTRS